MRGDLQEGHGCSSRCQSLSFRAQNQVFCALLGSGTPVFGHFEHKIWVFVRFRPPEPPFSGVSSTKSGFLCAFGLRDRHFRAFRAQNRGFCALLPTGRAERAGRAERVEREGQAGQEERAGVLSSQKKRVANVVTLLSFASLL